MATIELAPPHLPPGSPLSADRQQKIEACLEQLERMRNVTGVAIAIREEEGFECAASAGSAPPVGTRLNLSEGLSADCARTKQTIYSADTLTDARVDPEICRALHLRAVLIVPMLHRSELVGMVELFSDAANAFSAEMRKVVADLSEALLRDIFMEPAVEPEPVSEHKAVEAVIPEPVIAPPPPKPEVKAEPAKPVRESVILPEPVAPAPVAVASAAAAAAAPAPKIVPTMEASAAPAKPEPPLPRDVDQIRALFNTPAPASSASSSTYASESSYEETEEAAWYKSTPVLAGGGAAVLLALVGGWALLHHRSAPVPEPAAQPTVAQSFPAAPVTTTAVDKPSAATPVSSSQPAAVPVSSSSTSSEKDKQKQTNKPAEPELIRPAAQHGAGVAAEGDAPPAPGLVAGAQDRTMPGVFGSAASKVVLDAPQARPATRAGGKLLFKVAPSYPEAAKSLHIEGTVVMNVSVAADGTVKQVKAKSGPPILFESAQAAVRQWRYEPLILDGKAVEQQVEVNVVFRAK